MLQLKNLNLVASVFLISISPASFSDEHKTPFKIDLKPIEKNCLIEYNALKSKKNGTCPDKVIQRTSELVNAMNYCLLDMGSQSFCNEALNQLEEITPTYNNLVENINKKAKKQKQKTIITAENLKLMKKIFNQ